MKVSLLLAAVVTAHTAFAQQVSPKPLNINFKNRGYFYAASAPTKGATGLGGWWASDNMYRPVEPDRSSAGLIVWLRPEERQVFAEQFSGFALYIINQTNDTVFFEAQDSRLNMKLQAQDKTGKWCDIEYLPRSWCGNSYHHVYLPAGYQWTFTVPEYEGTLKTRIRAVLAFKSELDAEEQLLYSNEIPGNVNPGQFENLPEYRPNGIMDPYDN